jgi:hypothetical protein
MKAFGLTFLALFSLNGVAASTTNLAVHASCLTAYKDARAGKLA